MSEDEFQFNSEEDAIQLLEDSRKTILNLDQEIFKLILKRTKTAKGVALAKAFLGKNILDEKREETIYNNVKKITDEEGEDNINDEIILRIVKLLMELSKDFQKNIKE
ncbi:MAG: chorismate mutase [Methanobrevibacter sp.]|jgi:chorismate mutase|nr:chorismate mutase [Methanobrevibacter sp.]